MNLINKKGFTLLEIIVVVIIVGVLASLALPKLFSTVEFSKSSEALKTFSTIRSSMERCNLSKGSYANCATFAELDVINPDSYPGTHFSYDMTVGADPTTDYIVSAYRLTVDGGDGTSQVLIQQDSNNVTKWGTGAFAGL